jgi:hypothetical protein
MGLKCILVIFEVLFSETPLRRAASSMIPIMEELAGSDQIRSDQIS